jgi:ATP-dependent helicase/nuclease subunit B
MPAPQVTRIAFQDDTLQILSQALLDGLSSASAGDLSAALVLLPSTRACRSLQHRLLEMSGRDTLLLPRIQTVTQWADEMKTAVGLSDTSCPDDRTRALILAPALQQMSWLADHPESAPGLAHELITFFDEARLHGRATELLDPAQRLELQALTGPADVDVLNQDLARIHEAWAAYRRLVPRDRTDVLQELAAALQQSAPRLRRPPECVFVAGFSRVDPTRAALLSAALASGDTGRVFLPTATGPLAKLLLATWGAEPCATDPLAPAREVERLLTGQTGAIRPAAATLRARLADLRRTVDPADLLAPAGPLELIACGSAENESRVVADRVAAALAATEDSPPRITVAVNDPQLATRIRAHLNAAGIDSDDTHGDPLSALPAGLLVRFILRTALTDLRSEPLLEVLTHPYVQLPVSEGHHSRWTTRLEQMFRRDQGPRGGLAALHRRADERDEAVLNLFRDEREERTADSDGMVAFVTLLADAFAPMLPFRDRKPRPWRELLTALRACWALLAPAYALEAGKTTRPDIAKLHALLVVLERDAAILPAATLAAFSSDLSRLLATENVAAHRRPHLPVVISGLVEARLERTDILILAGLRDGVFPKPDPRPLFLAGAVRERLGLPGWQAPLARDAELFARLLHNAPRVLLTWATEADGTPALPSSFVTRLELVLPPLPGPSASAREWRTRPVPWAEIAASERAFSAAERQVAPAAAIRPLTRLSWSALRTWRDCPYRFLLERGFALRREEEVQEEFRRQDYGNLVHRALQDWLAPDSEGFAALAAGDMNRAHTALDAAARHHFEPGSLEMPQRRLWLESLRAAMPGLVATESARFATWRPLAVEREFTLPLPVLAAWTQEQAAALEMDPALPALDSAAEAIALRGVVDRIDHDLADPAAVSVIDYKTGAVPSARSVADAEELQIVLYAAAVELGALELDGGPHHVREGIYYGVQREQTGPPRQPHLAGAEPDGRRVFVQGAARLVQLALAAADPAGGFPVLPREFAGEGPSRLPCVHCDFRGVCRVEELDVPAHTERKLDKLVNRKDPW